MTMTRLGVTCPNRQWENWTPSEIAALDDLAPRSLVVLVYDVDTLGFLWTQRHIHEYQRMHPHTVIMLRPYNDRIPELDPADWAMQCHRRALAFGIPEAHLIGANEINLPVEHGHDDWERHADWLEKFAHAFRALDKTRPLHLPALSPVGSYRYGWRVFYAWHLHQLYDVADCHCYPGSLDSWRDLAATMPLPVAVTEFNATDPLAFANSLDSRVTDAVYFILGGTDDQKAYDLIGSPYYDSFRVAANRTPAVPFIEIITTPEVPDVTAITFPDYLPAVWVGSPHFGYPRDTAGRGGHKPVAIVHHIAEGTRDGVAAWFANPDSQVSAHYLVSKEGQVLQFVAEADAAWANGVLNRPDLTIPWLNDCARDKVNPNLVTISIEHEGIHSQPISDAQYRASLDLVRDIHRRHGWPIDDPSRQVGHSAINSVDRANCPGATFPLARLRADVKGLPFNVAEVSTYANWVLASLANSTRDVRGDAGLLRFMAHLAAIGADALDPFRYGWPVR